jgi:hypothetical protein
MVVTVAVVLVLLVTDHLLLVQSVALVVLVVELAVQHLMVAQLVTEYFTFSTKEQL